MIDLLETATHIAKNHPEAVTAVYDALLYMATTPDAALSTEYEETMDYLFSMTPYARAQRKAYEQTRAA